MSQMNNFCLLLELCEDVSSKMLLINYKYCICDDYVQDDISYGI